MLLQFSFIIIIFIVNSRINEDIYTIQNSIISNITKINYSITINGTNHYIYTFKTKNIFFTYDKNDIYESNNTIFLFNPKITILFFLSINETNDNIFDIDYYSKHDIITDKLITAKINFESIKYFQANKDFSFEMLYQLKELENTIHFSKLKEVTLFNYLIYNEKSALYDNKTFYDYSKSIILNTTLERMKKNIIYYPECDSLHYFNLLYEYFLNQDFDIYASTEDGYIFSGTVEYFIYEEIKRSNGAINLTNVEIGLYYMETRDKYYDDDKGTFDGFEIFKMNFFMIDQELKPVFPYFDIIKDFDVYCYFDAFNQIINKTRKAFGEN